MLDFSDSGVRVLAKRIPPFTSVDIQAFFAHRGGIGNEHYDTELRIVFIFSALCFV